MAYKYTYPIVDRSLRNFLVFMFVLMAVVAVAMAIQITYGVDVTGGLLSEAQTMSFYVDGLDEGFLREIGVEEDDVVTI